MKPHYARRRNYIRPKSRHARNGLGYDRHEALWRYSEEAKFRRFEARATDLLVGRKILRETDPQAFYQSPFLPRPHRDPDAFLPGRRFKLGESYGEARTG